MNVQTLEIEGKKFAFLPYDDYRKLVSAIEMAEDLESYDEVIRQLESGEEELTPLDLTERILDGESPIKVYREYRGYKLYELAKEVGISEGYLSQIESGVRIGSTKVLKLIANALNLSLDDIVSS